MDCTEEMTELMEYSVSTSSPGSQTLIKLDTSTDCYEAFLLNLLKVYTQNKSNTSSEGDNTTTDISQTPRATTTSISEGAVFTIDSISPEAINALSQEQVQSLVTSNSMTYDVIHQILAHRQKIGGGEGVVGMGAEVGTGEEKRTEENMSALQQLQALQLTPEQLKQIQLQMAELIRTKQIILPTELSLEQQQQLLQSLILKQVHSQHQQLITPTPATVQSVDTSSSIVTTNSSTKTTSTEGGGGSSGNSTLVAMLRGGSDSTEVNQESDSSRGEKTVKLGVPPPSNFTAQSGDAGSIALQLSPNPVVSQLYNYAHQPKHTLL